MSDDPQYVIDSSKLSDYARCPRYYFFRHVMGWRPDTANNHLAFGSAFHEALAHLYTTKEFSQMGVNEAMEKFIASYVKEIPETVWDAFHPKTPYSAQRALEAYVERYASDLREYEVEEVEVNGNVAVTTSDNIFFRLDTILRDQKGVRYVLEHKTGSYVSSVWGAQWILSLQVGTYTHVLRSLYKESGGVIVNGVFFSKAKESKIDFSRVRSRITEDQMEVWHATITNLIEQINYNYSFLSEEIDKEYDVQLSFPLNPTSCTHFNRVCEFHDFCTAWKAPFQHTIAPQGFVVEYWDPRRREKDA